MLDIRDAQQAFLRRCKVAKVNPWRVPGGSPEGGQYTSGPSGSHYTGHDGLFDFASMADAKHAWENGLFDFTKLEGNGPMYMVNRLTQVLHDEYYQKGKPMPEVVRFEQPHSAFAMATMQMQQGVMTVAPGQWASEADMDKGLQAMHDSHWLVGNSFEDLVHHEMGHFLHVQGTMEKFNVEWDEAAELTSQFKHDGQFTAPSLQQTIKYTISDYAKTNPLEFIAEAYVYQRKGKTLDDTGQRYYKMWGGPKV